MNGTADVRASDEERQQAVDALSTHVQSQRLRLDEFDQRVAKATVAEFRGQLLDLFNDLPEPHPHFDEPARAAAVSRASKAPVTRSGSNGTLRTAAYALFPLSGIIAFVLMITTGSWLWLLVVPPVAYLVRELVKKSGDVAR